MNTQVPNWKRIMLSVALFGAIGCVPAPDRQETKVIPASSVKITMDKSGHAVAESQAAQAESDAPAGEDKSEKSK